MEMFNHVCISLVFVTHLIIQFDGPYSRMKLVYGVEHLHKCTLLILCLHVMHTCTLIFWKSIIVCTVDERNHLWCWVTNGMAMTSSVHIIYIKGMHSIWTHDWHRMDMCFTKQNRRQWSKLLIINSLQLSRIFCICSQQFVHVIKYVIVHRH